MARAEDRLPDPTQATSTVERVQEARSQAHTALRVERDALERHRVRRFLSVLLLLIVFTWGAVAVWLLASDVQPFVARASVAAMLLLTVVTGGGWVTVQRRPETGPRVVVALLYISAAIPICTFYLGGEFESAALALVVIPVVMAPMFTAKRHAWGLAATTTALYGLLLLARYLDALPYGYMVAVHHRALVHDPYFLVDTSIGFVITMFGVAYLSGQASLDILTSHRTLADEVDRQTRRLARSNAELNDRNRALDEFNAALSHDLKSPLQTAILAADQLIYEPPGLVPSQVELAETIIKSSSRMADLTRELLKLSRLSDVLGDGERVDLGEVAAEAVEDLAQPIAERGARVTIVAPMPAALANPGLIREALQNLIENGTKYGADPGPEVRISAAPAPWGRVAVAVEDNGPGVPEDQRDLVFRPFLRLSRDLDRSEGVGAGLAIVQRIVTVHGGSVRVEDGQELPGARFVIELSAFGPTETLRD